MNKVVEEYKIIVCPTCKTLLAQIIKPIKRVNPYCHVCHKEIKNPIDTGKTFLKKQLQTPIKSSTQQKGAISE